MYQRKVLTRGGHDLRVGCWGWAIRLLLPRVPQALRRKRDPILHNLLHRLVLSQDRVAILQGGRESRSRLASAQLWRVGRGHSPPPGDGITMLLSSWTVKVETLGEYCWRRGVGCWWKRGKGDESNCCCWNDA